MGRKPKRGEGVIRFNISLTPTARDRLDAQAEALGISRAELIERFAREQLNPIQTQEVKEAMGET